MSELQRNYPEPTPRRQTQRRGLMALATAATLIALFYLEEDWRGRHAWENVKQEVEAKGVVLDWAKLAPPPVPDDQNFFTANPNIALRFKKAQTDAESDQAAKNTWLRISYEKNSFPVFDNKKSQPLVVALINISSTSAVQTGAKSNGPALKLDDPNTAAKVQALIQKTIGRGIHGAAGFDFSEVQLDNISPARIQLQADQPPAIADLVNFVPSEPATTNLGRLEIQAGSERDTFQVTLANVHETTAEDYLKWSDQFVPALDEVRTALKRPAAVLPGDYSLPALIPIPNFVTMRAVAQTLAQRAQCDFLLGRPGEALYEMTLMHDFCRILKRPPAGRPITLVESMINVAIAGLYAATVADGLRLHAWQEPQLAALQQQLKDDDLLSPVAESLENEQASAVFSIIHLPSKELQKLNWPDRSNTLRKKLTDPLYVYSKFAPKGWLYQNAVVHVRDMQKTLQGYDLANQLISPKTIDDSQKLLPAHPWAPYSFMVAVFLPNLSKATLTTAYNQTLIHQAEVACALERFHLAHGNYPETLDSLMPQFIETLPHDVIGGQPLYYRRTDEGKFLLYSIGWNEKDDGGTVVLNQDASVDRLKGDWIWMN